MIQKPKPEHIQLTFKEGGLHEAFFVKEGLKVWFNLHYQEVVIRLASDRWGRTVFSDLIGREVFMPREERADLAFWIWEKYCLQTEEQAEYNNYIRNGG